MTSLFNFSQAGGASGNIPVDLISCGKRGVAPLEFFDLDGRDSNHDAAEEAEQFAEPTAEFVANERAQQMQVMIEAAREDAAGEARRSFDAELESKLREERLRVERAYSEFAMDRQRYFAAAEAQVVKLAVAIAKRVLAREVAADTMHLTATVRAALGRVHDGSASVLRVRPDEVPQWSALFANVRDGSVSVIGDEHLDAGECVLETEVGRVELGVEAQLAEVERGFGDLLRRQGA